MIRNRSDYKYYLNADAHCLYTKKPSFLVKAKDDIWRYERVLRKCEYLLNTNKFPHPLMNPLYFYNKIKLRKLGYKLGFSISENTFEEGLSIVHYGSIIVNPNAKIGKNCRIHSGVNIGSGARGEGVPTIGNNVYIGPGAKIFGNIIIGDDIVIGANAVVNKSFIGGTIAGVPAHKVSESTSDDIIKRNEW